MGMEYYEHPGINHSTLKAFAKGAAHVKHQIEVGTVETDAMRLGTLAHLHVLEPELVDDMVVVAPEINRSTQAGKEKNAAFEKESKGKIIATKDQDATARSIAKAVREHPAVQPLMGDDDYDAEVECFWVDEFFGIECNAKIDGVRSDGMIFDLKTTQDASPSGFNRAIFNMHYHTQAAWYMHGLARAGLGMMPSGFTFIAVEKTAPFEVSVIRMTPEALKIGSRLVHSWLSDYYNRSRSGNWISNPQIVDVEVPGWIKNKEDK